jgi:hypothetical protein
MKYKKNYQVKENEIDRACRKHGAKKYTYRISVGKPEGKRPPETS